MNIEKALCPAQQAKGVIELVIDGRAELDETTIYALYSVSDNLDRVLAAVYLLLDQNNVLFDALTRRGIYDEVMAEVEGAFPEQEAANKPAARDALAPLAGGDAEEVRS